MFGDFIDKVPIGPAFNKGLTFTVGQAHVHCYRASLTRLLENNDIDPSFVITHTVALEKARELYRTFSDKAVGCIKGVPSRVGQARAAI